MASRKRLRVIFAPSIRGTLRRIWIYSASRWGEKRADSYLSALNKRLFGLARDYDSGKPLADEKLRRILFKRRNSDDGYVVIYEVDEHAGNVSVHAIFHTKQDWADDYPIS